MLMRRCAQFVHRGGFERPVVFQKIDGWAYWPLLARLKVLPELDALASNAELRFAVRINGNFAGGRDFAERFLRKYGAEGDHLSRVLGKSRARDFSMAEPMFSYEYSLEQCLQRSLGADLWVFDNDADAAA